jgi:hypothetical protein
MEIKNILHVWDFSIEAETFAEPTEPNTRTIRLSELFLMVLNYEVTFVT